MSEALVTTINLSYLVGAYMFLRALKLPFIHFGSWTSAWATLFIASIFYAIGLFLFDIPFMLSSTDYESIQMAKKEWWLFPLATFVALAMTLGFRVILGYVRGNLHKRRSKSYLFLAACSITTCFMVFFIISWFRDPDLADPGLSEYILFVILWLLGVGFFTFGPIAGKAVLRAKERR